jgi:hypothetical protein
MKSAMETGVVSADRIRGQGVIIEFDDGSSALYSASLLRSMLPKAERLKNQPKAAAVANASKIRILNNPKQN